MSGEFHLHCYLRLENQCSIVSPLHLDLLYEGLGYHGNYRSCRSPRLVQNYCLKESVCGKDPSSFHIYHLYYTNRYLTEYLQ